MILLALITKKIKGTEDVLPKQSYRWQFVENIMREEARAYGFKEIRTPVFEHTELFARGVGQTTDVVQKEMYTFDTKGGESVTLRPEGTAGAARAVLEHSLEQDGLPIKASYFVSCYRYEKPQAGRLREFHQFGIEEYGTQAPAADAEIICLAQSVLDRLGLSQVHLEINSIGCPECRAKYNQALKEYFTQYKDRLCPTCLTRLEKNPMRLLDCKSPEDKEIAKDAPKITDYLCEECEAHFTEVKKYLDAAGVEYPTNDMTWDQYAELAKKLTDKDKGIYGTHYHTWLSAVANWAVCDGKSPKALLKDESRFYAKICEWLKSTEPYTVRFGVNMLMAFFLDDRFDKNQLKLVAAIDEKIFDDAGSSGAARSSKKEAQPTDRYYVQMVIAWYMATALAKQWDATFPYIKGRKLSPWIHNKTIQKACESYRITDAQKKILRGLKLELH